MVNILDLMKGQLGDAAMGKIGELVGMDSKATSSAMGTVLPSILGGIMSKGSTESGASGMLDFMKNNEIGGGMFDNLSGFLGNGNKTSSLMKVGGLVLPFLLGGKSAGFMNIISKVTGIGGGKAGSLVSLVAPMVMGMISKQVGSGGVSGLMNLLSGQKDHVKGALPAGMGDLLGFSSQVKGATSNTTSNTTSTGNAGGGGMLKWLLPLLAVLAAVWYFTKDGCATASTDMNETEETSMTTPSTTATTTTEQTAPISTNATTTENTQSTETTANTEATTTTAASTDAVSSSNDMGGFTIDAKGNLLDASNKIVAAAGSFKTVDGFYVDSNGNRIGKVFQKIKDAIGNAGEKTADFFKEKFSNILKPKAGGDVASSAPAYTLSKMTFDPKSQRISYYSKPEFMGLAAALKASNDSKIVVKVHTADGKNERENKKLSTMRAQQIQSMLQTLGVSEKQMSFKGMGSQEAGKAAANSIEIDTKD